MIQQDSLEFRKRGPNRYKSDFKIKQAYKLFTDSRGKVATFVQYRRICTAMNEYIMQEVLLKGHDFFLPCNLGSLGIRKKKMIPFVSEDGKVMVNHLSIDYKATKEFWRKNPQARAAKKLIRQLNDHTENYRYKFHWDKATSSVLNQSAYRFIPTRSHSRLLAKILLSPDREVDFVTLINYKN
jgi:hypothetical protein